MLNAAESKDYHGLKGLFQNGSSVIFIVYSLLFVSFPIAFNKFSLFFLVVTLLIIILYLIKDFSKTRGLRTFQFLLFTYTLYIGISFLMHFIALNTIEPLSYITVYKKSALWGLQTLKLVSKVYLLFPLLFLLLIYQLKLNYRMLYTLPLFIIPSLILAVYQAVVDIEFLNIPYFAKLHRTSGFGIDSNGLGLSIFLLFPLSVLAILINKDLWKRLFFIAFAFILLWCLFLSGTRTGLIGIIIFLCILPWILVWADKNIKSRTKNLLVFSPLILIIIFGGAAVVFLKKNPPFPLTLSNRLQTDYRDFKKGGIKEVLQESGRYELGLQAYSLTKLSPISGWGPGGFYRNLHNIRFRNGVMNYFRFDNANNHYLQMTSELGIIGGGLNLILHIIPLWMVFRIRKQIYNREEKLAVGIVFNTVVIMMLLFLTGPHTMAASVQWILVVMLSFLFVTAVRYGYSFKHVNVKLVGVLVISAILFAWGTYNNAFGKEGYRERQKADWWIYKYEKNCYDFENWSKGVVRWCKDDSALQIPILPRRSVPEEVRISFCMRNPDIKSRPVEIRYGGKSGRFHRMLIQDYSWKTVKISITDDYIFEHTGPDNVTRRYFVLFLDVSRTWIPKEWGVNEDTRELGVAVLIPLIN